MLRGLENEWTASEASCEALEMRIYGAFELGIRGEQLISHAGALSTDERNSLLRYRTSKFEEINHCWRGQNEINVSFIGDAEDTATVVV